MCFCAQARSTGSKLQCRRGCLPSTPPLGGAPAASTETPLPALNPSVLGKTKPSGASASPGHPMATNMAGAVEELSPRTVSPGSSSEGRVQTQTGALGTSPLPYPHAGSPPCQGTCQAPRPSEGAADHLSPPTTQSPAAGFRGKPSPPLGLGLLWPSPASLRHGESDVAFPCCRCRRGGERSQQTPRRPLP